MALDTSAPLRVLTPGDLQEQSDAHQLRGLQSQTAQFQLQQAQQNAPVENQLKQLQVQKEKTGIIAQTLYGTRDQASWTAGRQRVAQLFGPEVLNGVPEQFDPQIKDQLLMSTLTSGQQLDYDLKKMALGISAGDKAYDHFKDDRDYGLKEREFNSKQGGGFTFDDGQPFGGQQPLSSPMASGLGSSGQIAPHQVPQLPLSGGVSNNGMNMMVDPTIVGDAGPAPSMALPPQLASASLSPAGLGSSAQDTQIAQQQALGQQLASSGPAASQQLMPVESGTNTNTITDTVTSANQAAAPSNGPVFLRDQAGGYVNQTSERSAKLPDGFAYARNPSGQGLVPVRIPGTQRQTLSPTEQKELFDTTDVISNSEGSINALTAAKNLLNNKDEAKRPYSGITAGFETYNARIPISPFGDKVRGAATTEYNNLITEQALSSLKATFGGNPTEGERQILLSLQAISDYNPEEQNRILTRAIDAAQRRSKFNKSKAEAIQGKDYSGVISAASNAGQSAASPGGVKFIGFE